MTEPVSAAPRRPNVSHNEDAVPRAADPAQQKLDQADQRQRECMDRVDAWHAGAERHAANTCSLYVPMATVVGATAGQLAGKTPGNIMGGGIGALAGAEMQRQCDDVAAFYLGRRASEDRSQCEQDFPAPVFVPEDFPIASDAPPGAISVEQLPVVRD